MNHSAGNGRVPKGRAGEREPTLGRKIRAFKATKQLEPKDMRHSPGASLLLVKTPAASPIVSPHKGPRVLRWALYTIVTAVFTNLDDQNGMPCRVPGNPLLVSLVLGLVLSLFPGLSNGSGVNHLPPKFFFWALGGAGAGPMRLRPSPSGRTSRGTWWSPRTAGSSGSSPPKGQLSHNQNPVLAAIYS